MRPPEVLVLGAGPAGIAAATRAAEAGARTLLVDDNPRPGGQIWRGLASNPWLQRLQRSGAAVHSGRAFFHPAQRPASSKLILCTGARELFLPFPGWTLPGVFGAGGLQALVKSGLDIAGRRVAIAGSGPLLIAAAATLREHGATIVHIAEQAPLSALLSFSRTLLHDPSKLLQAVGYGLQLAGVPFSASTVVTHALGHQRLTRIRLSQGSKVWEVPCDYLACAYGLVPNTEAAALLGCETSPQGVRVDQRQETTVDGIFAAGELTGIGGLSKSLVEGQIAGLMACGLETLAARLFPARERAHREAALLQRCFEPSPALRDLPTDETLVCRCEDVAHGTLRHHASARAAKLQTRCGMGPCQGRVCGPATRFLYSWDALNPRPPLSPAPIDQLLEIPEL